MRTLYIILLAMSGAVAATAGPVLSRQDQSTDLAADYVPAGGMLRTMPHGAYECALPGDAGGRAYEVVPAEGFQISTASRYRNEIGAGTYILRGRKLTFTAGPKNGERFERVGDNQLRKVDPAGKASSLLCTRLADRRQ
ncbi:MAG: elongation factor P [Pseudomonadota bacterium]